MIDKSNDVEPQIGAVRRFNRFYTQKIGVLEEHLTRSPFSLTEARVLYEIAHREKPAAADIARDLGLDPGYLSRTLATLEKRGLIDRQASPADGRASLLSLAPAGKAAFADLDRGSREAVAQLLAGLSGDDRRRLTGAMEAIRSALGDGDANDSSFVLRTHQPGDMGWIVHRQGLLYAREYGWDETYEALAAEIVAKFIRNFDAARERCWIAERHGEIVGSVFCVRDSDAVAKLRLLYVDPEARGLGIGRRLVEEVVRFARGKGYATLSLWTNDVLAAARHLYESAGFRLISQGRHKSFGKDLVGQTWELTL